MRFMKRLLTAVYLYVGVFFALCLIVWIVTRQEPAALIAGISAAAGVESVITGLLRIREMQEEGKRKEENPADAASPVNPDRIDPAWGEK